MYFKLSARFITIFNMKTLNKKNTKYATALCKLQENNLLQSLFHFPYILYIYTHVATCGYVWFFAVDITVKCVQETLSPRSVEEGKILLQSHQHIEFR